MDNIPESVSEEAVFIRQARQGSAAGWEALVKMHQEPVFRYAYLLIGDADEAEDIAQEAFIRAYQALGRFDETRPVRPWLLRITANLAHNHHRSAGRYLAALRRLAQAEPVSVMKTEDKAALNLQKNALWEAVQRLHESDQQIIYLRHFLEFSIEDTAAAANIAPGTVKSRLHRALTRLRSVVQQHYAHILGTEPG